MNYNEFVAYAVEGVKPYLSEDIQVDSIEVEKLKGASYFGISARDKKDPKISVTMDIHSVYEEMGDKSVDILMQEIAEHLTEALKNSPNVPLESLRSFEWVKNHMMLEMISIEGNENLLEKVVHDTYEDLAAVYRIRIDENASSIVHKAQLDVYGVTEEEFKKEANAYSFSLDNIKFRTIEETIQEIMDLPMEDVPKDGPMYVVSSMDGVDGAGCLFYPGFLEKARKRLGQNFFVIPSSVHEVILLRDEGGMNYEDLKGMIKEINSTVVEKNDVLSDSLYYVGEDLTFRKIA